MLRDIVRGTNIHGNFHCEKRITSDRGLHASRPRRRLIEREECDDRGRAGLEVAVKTRFFPLAHPLLQALPARPVSFLDQGTVAQIVL